MFTKITFITIFAIGLVLAYDSFKNTTECQEVKKVSVAALKNCTFEVIDFKAAGKEIEEASTNGQASTVIKKYCDKSTELRACLLALSGDVRECLDSSVKNLFGHNKASEVLEYVCANDGSRAISFVNEGGIQCWNEQLPKFEACAAEIFGNINKDSLPDPCKTRESVGKCIVNSLKECPSQKPSQILESFFTDVACDNNSYN